MNGPPSYANGGTYGPPPAAPPSYAQTVGGVPPASPYVPPVGPNVKGHSLITTVVPLGPDSTRMICPHCQFEINSVPMEKPGPLAYISGLLLALFGCWLGCCLIPCCIPECMDVHHTCPNCETYLGRFRR